MVTWNGTPKEMKDLTDACQANCDCNHKGTCGACKLLKGYGNGRWEQDQHQKEFNHLLFALRQKERFRNEEFFPVSQNPHRH
jgi:hypothetical protein